PDERLPSRDILSITSSNTTCASARTTSASFRHTGSLPPRSKKESHSIGSRRRSSTGHSPSPPDADRHTTSCVHQQPASDHGACAHWCACAGHAAEGRDGG